jgi:electron transfer flavoprotein beta subunit
VSAMRILACFRVTPDYEALRESEWSAAAGRGASSEGGAGAGRAAGASAGRAADPADFVDTRYVRRILDCFDESALELALRLSDALVGLGGTADLGALSVGTADAEPHLRTLLALGFERAARVHTEAALDFAPAATAAMIAAYAGRIDRSDLLLLGARSGPGGDATLPFRVAEQLGWPCLTQVTEVEPLVDGGVRVTLMTDDGPARLTARTPCVLAVGNAVVSHLRVPTLTDRLTVRDKQPVIMEPADLGVEVAERLGPETSSLVALESIDRHREVVLVPGATPRAKAQALFDSRLKSLLEEL